MKIIQGKGVYGAIAFGEIHFLTKSGEDVIRRNIDDIDAELSRFETARLKAIKELDDLYNKALPEVGEQGASLFSTHQLMLEDLDYIESIQGIINVQKVNSEYAVSVTGDNFARLFTEMADPYMQERAADVRDVSQRVIHCLTGQVTSVIDTDKPLIIAANDLSPSETIQLDKNKVLAFITAGGSTNSHTAILSRAMGIPAVIGVGAELKSEFNGSFAIVDGFTGKIYINPDKETAEQMRQQDEKSKEHKELLQQYKNKPNITKDGVEVKIYANMSDPSELNMVMQNDAGGIGLFRSEFLYMGRETYPTEEEQFRAYKEVAQTMAGKEVVFRTMDIGADKQIDYFEIEKEENPALGLRGIRLSLERTELFKTQLRALYRASAYGKILIMFPMIASVWEVQEAKGIIEQIKRELYDEGLRYDENVEIGIMIETPAAAIISDQLAEEVDFFSVGTNDLIQYTLAADRQNQGIDRYIDTHHPAVLSLIATAAKSAHKHGIWIGICGELAADYSLTKTFLKMGIDELSVAPTAVLGLRRQVTETTVG